MHAWSAIDSAMTMRIQRHSDHHAHKFRPYQVLRRLERAPTMPYEYVQMLLLALCPPLYWHVINPMCDAMEDAKKGIANQTKWNAEMPMSEDDKKRDRVAQIYFGAVFVVYTIIVFYFSPNPLKFIM